MLHVLDNEPSIALVVCACTKIFSVSLVLHILCNCRFYVAHVNVFGNALYNYINAMDIFVFEILFLICDPRFVIIGFLMECCVVNVYRQRKFNLWKKGKNEILQNEIEQKRCIQSES